MSGVFLLVCWQSQYDEHEVEQMRLEQEARRLKEEFEQVETQRNQEYQQLKQEKELEISNLKGMSMLHVLCVHLRFTSERYLHIPLLKGMSTFHSFINEKC